MGKKFNELLDKHIEFIRQQKIFFIGTAMETGKVNVSPKGMDTLRVTESNKVVWLNLTGSGNETSTHVQNNGRMTIMFCAFEGKPNILRLYGEASVFHESDETFQTLKNLFPDIPGSRQIFVMNIDLVQSSCGFAVPFMDFKSERTQLADWAQKQGEDRIKKYWKDRNTKSLDGHSTKILD